MVFLKRRATKLDRGRNYISRSREKYFELQGFFFFMHFWFIEKGGNTSCSRAPFSRIHLPLYFINRFRFLFVNCAVIQRKFSFLRFIIMYTVSSKYLSIDKGENGEWTVVVWCGENGWRGISTFHVFSRAFAELN